MPRTNAEPQLRHKIELHAESHATNALGEQLSGYALSATVWADARALGAGESYRAQRLGQDTTHRFLMRWRPGVGNNWRIVWRGKRFRVVTAVDHDERKEWLEIMATEESAD